MWERSSIRRNYTCCVGGVGKKRKQNKSCHVLSTHLSIRPQFTERLMLQCSFQLCKSTKIKNHEKKNHVRGQKILHGELENCQPSSDMDKMARKQLRQMAAWMCVKLDSFTFPVYGTQRVCADRQQQLADLKNKICLQGSPKYGTLSQEIPPWCVYSTAVMSDSDGESNSFLYSTNVIRGFSTIEEIARLQSRSKIKTSPCVLCLLSIP